MLTYCIQHHVVRKEVFRILLKFKDLSLCCVQLSIEPFTFSQSHLPLP